MGENFSLTENELGALFGDAKEQNVVNDEQIKKELSGLQQALQASVAPVKSALATMLGEELECVVSDIEIINGLQTLEAGEFYVVDGNFSNNGLSPHYFAFPRAFAFQLVRGYSGVEGIQDVLEEIQSPLLEIAEKIINSICAEMNQGFAATVNAVSEQSDLSDLEANAKFIRVLWQVGSERFYEFFSAAILNLYQAGEQKKGRSEQDDIMGVSDELGADMGEGVSMDDIGGEEGSGDKGEDDFLGIEEEPEPSSKGFASLLGSTDSGSESIASLGEELLKGSQSVSGVNLPEFGENGAAAGSKKELSILFGVSMEVTVELGQTKMKLEEILELNRGSIIELRKLAGEPLDIKVNNKLIAKGEVVVIDENFGVRIIEISSPKDRINEMN